MCKYRPTTCVAPLTGMIELMTQGWVKSARKQKQLVFIDVNDGSALKSLQVVASLDQLSQ